ncbi:MAG: hypothetical protein CMJ20_11330, partial [Phycisphaeraceae bacterium]|nr:hypothetical protein [Phycisphaeraceae bacterium]
MESGWQCGFKVVGNKVRHRFVGGNEPPGLVWLPHLNAKFGHIAARLQRNPWAIRKKLVGKAHGYGYQSPAGLRVANVWVLDAVLVDILECFAFATTCDWIVLTQWMRRISLPSEN